ncbi:lactate permease [Phascolomyces articulosus]|uniref:Lactate permease n=1 Tax=Phascolomyces articulosus TaxID=60185 RepID=A0AAD5KFX4_9FUNG|nr:lactate permease [Phascolomyces articulosus]
MSTNHPEIKQEAYDEGLFIQPIAPIGDSLVGSFFVGVIPLVVVLVLLGVFRLPAHFSSLAGLIVSIFIAIFGWHMPAQQAFQSIGNGIVFANWPIMWIVVNAMFIYNISVRSGVFDIFRRWIVTNTPPDMRVLLLVIGYAFGALLEGVAGFGTPGAICSALMVSLGFDKVAALTYTLIFDTTPVAFGALGIPVTTLANLTGLPVESLSAMMGRQLPFVSVFLPIYAVTFFAGFRAGFIECWPAAVVAGISFALFQAIFANFVGPELPDLIAGLVSLLSLIFFLRFWKPPYREEYACTFTTTTQKNDEEAEGAGVTQEKVSAGSTQQQDEKVEVSQTDKLDNGSETPSGSGLANDRNSTHSKDGDEVAPNPEAITPISELVKPTLWESILAWSPWVCILVVVIIWSFVHVPKYGAIKVQWPQLHNRIWLTLYGKKYEAYWNFEPLATGTAILISNIPFSCLVIYSGVSPKVIPRALVDTVKQLWIPVLTVSFIMALAYLYNFSGIVYTIGMTLSSVGNAFPFLSAWLGWVACFLSGSDTSANSLFGNLQVVAARQIGLSAVLMASTNSSGAVTSKMISPQNLATGVSTIQMQGREGYIFRKTILHSIFMCAIMGMIACIQQFGTPGIIPPGDEVLDTV